MASYRAVRVFLTVFMAFAAARAPAAPQPKAQTIFTVGNIKSEAEAADSVEAKKLATASAEMRAFRILISRVADFRAQARVPELPQEEVERLVSDIEVRGEGVSGTSYVATFAVTFSERAVGALFARSGIVPILDRGPELLIVPVYIEEGAAASSDRNAWRTALTSLDLTHALVPAKVAPVRGDITAAIANAYAANPQASLETLKSQYHTTQVLLAVAELDGRGGITVRLAGADALGPLTLQRKVRSKEAGDETLIQTAANLVFETVQERWKLTRNSYVPATPGDAAADGSASFSAGGMAPVLLTAEFSGLKEWQAIRSRLQGLPGVQNWDLRSVNPRSAEIAFDFPGGPDRLSAIAGGQGLSVERGPDGLVVKTR
jgi:hypothetical protein